MTVAIAHSKSCAKQRHAAVKAVFMYIKDDATVVVAGLFYLIRYKLL